MKSIREIVSTGINTLEGLSEALQLALELEFSTIPPYLCAQWSIIPGTDPSGVGKMVQSIVVQEMFHLSLVCNMMTAIGIEPGFTDTQVIPTYPADGLPGNVHRGLIVDLLPLGYQALNIFMQIEFPESGSIAMDPATIGAFYDTIVAGFEAVNPTFYPTSIQVITNIGADNLFRIQSVADAKTAIALIKDQGEGTDTSPEEGSADNGVLAHYYTFAQVYYGNKLVQGEHGWKFGGDPVVMPRAYTFTVSHQQPDLRAAFQATFLKILNMLSDCWANDPNSIGNAINTMFTLQQQGVALIQQGIRPEFGGTLILPQ